MKNNKKADLTNAEVQQIAGRSGIIKELDREITKLEYLRQAATNDVQSFIKELAVKHGLEEDRDYMVENGVIMVDESTAPAGTEEKAPGGEASITPQEESTEEDKK